VARGEGRGERGDPGHGGTITTITRSATDHAAALAEEIGPLAWRRCARSSAASIRSAFSTLVS
jgi:hypothetical protein